MITALMDIILPAIVVGAASAYTRNGQTRLSVIIVLLFIFFGFLGYLLAFHHFIYVENTVWVFDWIRFLITVLFTITAIVSFLPYYGFFHSKSKHMWGTAIIFFLFSGWHAGHWFESGFIFAGFVCLFIILYIAGNMMQGNLQGRWSTIGLVSYLPFVVLFLFSFLLLL